MKLTYLSFLIFILLKPYYMFESGGLQIGDLFFLLSLILLVINAKGSSNKIIDPADRLLVWFIIFVIIINSLYGLYYLRADFFISSLHYIFNFLIVVVFRNYSKDINFLNKLLWVLRINLWIQVLIYLFNLGRYYYEFTSRYMGTFNDPNQFAFFVYSSLLVMYLIAKISQRKLHIIDYLLAIFLIILSSSAGMLLGLVIFFIILFLMDIRKLINKRFKLRGLIIINFTFALVLSLLLFTNFELVNPMKIPNFENVLLRLEEKLVKYTTESNSYSDSYGQLSFVEERGIDKLLHYPQYSIWGAGQGFFSRFEKAAHHGEVHSTLISILFSYGLVPTMLILTWMLKNISKYNVATIPIFTSLFIESFTLLNQRQPFFWMLFILASVYCTKKTFGIKDNKEGVTGKEFINL